MINKLKQFNHWVWLVIKVVWTGIFVGTFANILSSDRALHWVGEHITEVIIVFASFTIITLIVGLVDRIQGSSTPWLRWTWGKYVAMGALLVIVVTSFCIPISPTPLAFTMLPLGTVAATLLPILVIIELVARTKSASKNASPTNKMFQRREVVSLIAGGGGGALLLAPPITRLNALLELLIPDKPPTIVTMVTSTEKTAWLQAAADAFNQQYADQGIGVELTDSRGSLDTIRQLLDGQQPRPVVWSPASYLESNLLLAQWQKQHSNRPDIIDTTGEFRPPSLVYSPLVFATWGKRAKVLSDAGLWPLDWLRLSKILERNWSDILPGHDNWGPVKFGQTQPDQSNSGLLTVVLLAYDYFNKTRNLDSSDIAYAQFQEYFKAFEKQGVWCFGPSSGTFIDDSFITAGPGLLDIITTYENLVIRNEQTAVDNWQQPLIMSYPPNCNIISEHPFVILQGDWVSNDQKNAAKQFLQFLLTPDQQRKALSYGFRSDVVRDPPTMQNVSLGPFSYLQQPIKKSREDLEPLAQPPGGEVIDTLTKLWQSQQGDDIHTC